MFEFLKPISNEVIDYVGKLPNHCLGKHVLLHTSFGLPELEEGTLIFFSVNEYRNSEAGEVLENFDNVRKEFYKLAVGDWDTKMADLGEISAGESVVDTYFVVKELVQELLQKKCITMILGGSQDITYANYRAYDSQNKMINIVNVDAHFDVGNVEYPITNTSFIGKIVVDKPYNLFNYINIGYQSYYVAPEELDLMRQMFFEQYRLGEVSSDLTLVEPAMRNADLVSVDLNVLEGVYFGNSPNGFSGKELCAIVRYAGISDKLTSFGIYEYNRSKCTNLTDGLVAQLFWYFVEGVNARWFEKGLIPDLNLTHYQVPIEDQILSFYKSNLTDRWWVEIDVEKKEYNNLNIDALLPCTYHDYKMACSQKIPERWFNSKMKYDV